MQGEGCDALTYSGKAATHKHVHPYLRYGILVGSYGGAVLPSRLVRHAAYFDFMGVWRDADPSDGEWRTFLDVISAEVVAWRELHRLLAGPRKVFHMLHRRLQVI